MDDTTTTNPAPRAGYGDEEAASEHVGYGRDRFRALVKKGVFKPGKALTANGKLLFKFSDLDAAVEKAWRSRKPRPMPRGIVRQRLEGKR
jgi:hypothetical protein